MPEQNHKKGSVSADLTIDSAKKSAVASLVYTSVTGAVVQSQAGVYFANIFANATDVPVGGFQNTDSACSGK